MQRVQDAEGVQPWNSQVTKREEDQTPGDAKQSGDPQQDKHGLLSSFLVSSLTLMSNI